ncbi:MAG TPA: hypothetical protein VKP04_06300, partial [Ktedonobacteraceae bacterium]|nr:hypothetical protein [Ktedonobacteraceae bacterium]
DLHLYWRDNGSTCLAIYPPLMNDVIVSEGLLTKSVDGFFTYYTVAVPEHTVELEIKLPRSDTLHIRVPATALDGVHDAFLCIDYCGDVGSAYLDGHLVSDHFANGSSWEIGLKRFMLPGMEQELVVRISPLQQNSALLRYFSDKIVLPAATDGSIPVEVYSITAIPEYHAALTQMGEASRGRKSNP